MLVIRNPVRRNFTLPRPKSRLPRGWVSTLVNARLCACKQLVGQIHAFTIWNVYVNLHVFRLFDKSLITLLPGGGALPTDEHEGHAGPSAEPRSNEGSHGVDAGGGESATTALTATLSSWRNLNVQLDIGAIDLRGPTRREAECETKSHKDA